MSYFYKVHTLQVVIAKWQWGVFMTAELIDGELNPLLRMSSPDIDILSYQYR